LSDSDYPGLVEVPADRLARSPAGLSGRAAGHSRAMPLNTMRATSRAAGAPPRVAEEPSRPSSPAVHLAVSGDLNWPPQLAVHGEFRLAADTDARLHPRAHRPARRRGRGNLAATHPAITPGDSPERTLEIGYASSPVRAPYFGKGRIFSTVSRDRGFCARSRPRLWSSPSTRSRTAGPSALPRAPAPRAGHIPRRSFCRICGSQRDDTCAPLLSGLCGSPASRVGFGLIPKPRG
jgi:hypothetical protein